MSVSKNSIQTVRYLRAVDARTLELSSSQAVTILFTIDYDTRQVFAQWAVTDGDNFSKSIGKEVAEKSPTITFHYDEVDKYFGLSNAFLKQFDKLGYNVIKMGNVVGQQGFKIIAKELNKMKRNLKG